MIDCLVDGRGHVVRRHRRRRTYVGEHCVYLDDIKTECMGSIGVGLRRATLRSSAIKSNDNTGRRNKQTFCCPVSAVTTLLTVVKSPGENSNTISSSVIAMS